MGIFRIFIAAWISILKLLLLANVGSFIVVNITDVFSEEVRKHAATFPAAYAEGIVVINPHLSFAVSWLDDKTSYHAGDMATIKIKLLNNSFGNINMYKMDFSVSVSGKKGNSSYISAVFSSIEDPTFWNISFTPIKIGNFSLVVVEDFSGFADSSLQFSVTAGLVYPSGCVPLWMDFSNEFVAGTKAYLLLFPKDAFGNNVSSVDMPAESYFTLSISHQNGTPEEIFTFFSSVWNELGYFVIEFIPTIAGRLFLHAYGDNKESNGSPLPFMVFIHQKDQFGNFVPGFYPFDAKVVQRATGLSIPLVDLLFQEVEYGVQLLSFVVSEPGEFLLTIFIAKLNESFYNLPYKVFVIAMD